MDIKGLLYILPMTDVELFNYVNSVPNTGYTKVVNNAGDDGYIIFVPENYDMSPLVCAHMDLAGKVPPKKYIVVEGNKISLSKEAKKLSFINFEENDDDNYYDFNSSYVLGGDDRCGVVICLALLKAKAPYTIAFFMGEESGGHGSKKFATDHPEILIKTTCYMGLDWIREEEFAVYHYGTPKGSAVLRNKLGYTEKDCIAYTDCSILSEIKHKPSFALSVGYYNQHTCNETIFFNSTLSTYNKLLQLTREHQEFWVDFDDVVTLYEYLAAVTTSKKAAEKYEKETERVNYMFKNANLDPPTKEQLDNLISMSYLARLSYIERLEKKAANYNNSKEVID